MRLRTKTTLVAGVTLAASALTIAGLATARSESRAVGSPTEDQLVAIRAKALEFAAANGDSSPSVLRAVAGTRNAVVKATMRGATVDTDQPVFVVEIQGDFVAHGASVPPGHPQPRGSHLLLVFDADDLELTDWAVTRMPTDLSVFGPPIPLES